MIYVLHYAPLPLPTPNVLMAEPVMVAIIAAGGGSVAGLAALIVGVLNHRREKRTSTTVELRALIEELRRNDTDKGRKIDDLCGKVAALEKGRREDGSRIRRLEDRVRDADELVADLTEQVIANDGWAAEVSVLAGPGIPTPPGKSWRVRRHLETYPPTPNPEETV